MGWLDKLMDIDMLDMVPAGTIEDAVRTNGSDMLQGVLQWAHQYYGLAPDERISIQLSSANVDGRETVVLVPMVLDAQLRTLRKLPWFDLVKLMETAPIAQYVRALKAQAKAMKKLQPVAEKLNAAMEAGDDVATRKYQAKLQEMAKDMPPNILGAMAAPASEPKVAQLPAATTGDDTPATDGTATATT